MKLEARWLAALAASLLVFAACAQPKDSGSFEPQVGQAGKDVIWVPTPDDVVERMLRMAQVTPKDWSWISARATARSPSPRRRSSARAPSASSTTPTWSSTPTPMRRPRASRATVRPRHHRHGDIFDRLQQGHRHHHVPAAGAQHEAAAANPRHAARHARGVALLHHGRLGSRRSLLHRRAPRLLLAGAGERHGHLDAGGRRRQSERSSSRSSRPSRR
jgi:hypothetical protein